MILSKSPLSAIPMIGEAINWQLTNKMKITGTMISNLKMLVMIA